ncbi:hypothetical protein [Pseudoroseomonas ludipueritiae]
MSINVNAAAVALVKAVRKLPPDYTSPEARGPIAIIATMKHNHHIRVFARYGHMPSGFRCSRYIRPSSKAGQKLIEKLLARDMQCAERLMQDFIKNRSLMFYGRLIKTIPADEIDQDPALYTLYDAQDEEETVTQDMEPTVEDAEVFNSLMEAAQHTQQAQRIVQTIHELQQHLDKLQIGLDEMERSLLDYLVQLRHTGE